MTPVVDATGDFHAVLRHREAHDCLGIPCE